MNKEQFAELLNGRQYRDEITEQEEKLAKENGLLVCFGASDDLLEFRGLVNEEVGAYDGGSAFLVKKRGGKIDVMSEYDFTEVQEIMDDKELDFELPKVEVVAEWSPDDLECSWRIKSDLPHATFDIMEDGYLYCRGIVIDNEDILKILNP
jgi:hypothetical protein